MFGDKLAELVDDTIKPEVRDIGNRLERLLYLYQNGVRILAKDVPIKDLGGYYELDNVEEALAETGAHLGFYNGSFHESFDALVTSDGATVTMSIEQSGGGDLAMRFSDGHTTLDTTPAATIALTAGSDTSPQANYIYILQSTKALTKSTTAWPATEHIKVAYFFVPSAGFVQTNGVYVNQNWNDHIIDTVNMGHMLHMAERSRRDGAYYFSGIAGNGTDGYLTPTASNVELKSTAGVVYQMHKHTVPAFDTSGTDLVLVKNWNGDAYHDITNLFDITTDSGGNTIGNNKWFNLVLWGIANKSGEFTTMMINLPSGFYNTQSNAESDVSGYDDFSIPREFALESSTAFMVARITIQMNTTWVVGSTVDLRGQTPTSASGGAAGIATDFPDNAFTVFDESDNTKIIAFDVGTNVTTGNTRTYKAPNADGTFALLEVANVFTLGATFGGNVVIDNNADVDLTLVLDSGATGAQSSQLVLRDQGTGVWTIRKDSANEFEILQSVSPFNTYMRFDQDNVITFNENGADIDFRVEGDTLPFMIFTNGSASAENIALLATAAPNWQSMDRGLFIGNHSAAPSGGNPSGGGFLYVVAGALTWKGSSGTVTTIAAA